MAEVFKIWNTYIAPATNAQLDVGSDTYKFNNLYIDGIAYLDEIFMGGNIDLNSFSIDNIGYLYGNNSADFIRMGVTNRLFITITGLGDPFATPDISISGSVWFDDNIGLDTTKQIQFRDDALYISSLDDGHLDLTADTSVDINGLLTTQDITADDIQCNILTAQEVIANSAQLIGDGVGVVSTNTFTGLTETPVYDPGWATSSSADMLAPDGYIKAYVGVQAVVIPYWVCAQPSPSYSPSASPSLSPSASDSLSPSSSPSKSPSLSPSISPSPSRSPSLSPSISPSPSRSPSLSPSKSPSPSYSPSLSPSASESISPSVSESVSPSISPSVSESLSPSASESISPSISPSISESLSPSISPSVSPSS